MWRRSGWTESSTRGLATVDVLLGIRWKVDGTCSRISGSARAAAAEARAGRVSPVSIHGPGPGRGDQLDRAERRPAERPPADVPGRRRGGTNERRRSVGSERFIRRDYLLAKA